MVSPGAPPRTLPLLFAVLPPTPALGELHSMTALSGSKEPITPPPFGVSLMPTMFTSIATWIALELFAQNSSP
jgi:hypothetical protein